MRKLILILFLLFLVLYSGCLKDSAISPVEEDTNYSKVFLRYLEAQGDYINSTLMPSVISVSEVKDSLGNDVILDVSSASQFSEGHVPGSLNILSAELFNYLDTASSQKRIIIVSRSGQAASYYAGLLRLAGFNNVYAMQFGMVGWNSAFSSYWGSSYSGKNFTNLKSPRLPYSKLPDINVENASGDIKNNLDSRIKTLLAESFDESTFGEVNSDASVHIFYLYTIYHSVDSTYTDTFIMNVGADGSYILGPDGKLDIPGHPPRAVFYYEPNGAISDLRSTAYLQTIPSDKNVVVYTQYGQSSAFIVAYLRLLGYKAKSLLFGARWREATPIAANFAYDMGN